MTTKLETALEGTTKTKIMYKAILSYTQLKEYLPILIENNLLECMEENRIYKTTDKGLSFLKVNKEIEDLLKTSSDQDCNNSICN